MRDLILYNAALRLWAAGVATSPAEGVEKADEACESGAVLDLLNALRSPAYGREVDGAAHPNGPAFSPSTPPPPAWWRR